LKQCLVCPVVKNDVINNDIFQLVFEWGGDAPRAGQFFLVKPLRSSVFLSRPVSVAFWDGKEVCLLIAKKGTGTEELADTREGENLELIGPLGNSWRDYKGGYKQDDKPIALVSGGIGVAPLLAFAAELTSPFHFFAGFKTALPISWRGIKNKTIATEDGSFGEKGYIIDFLSPDKYQAVFACGPLPMLKAAAASCAVQKVPCFVSMEKHMACGVGACLGCTVKTINGNKRCCTDGPIFPAEDLFFD
jgi:NAD(P)H-flavin reductase